MKEEYNDEFDDDEFDDGFTQMSRERDPFESQEDYEDRMQDLDDMGDYYNNH
ncbi:hypothetical protein LJB91_01910 [Bacteroidales bacterium OttesenSCG-928-L03]|nr:hypothetical protein [Bacteroidales bacterium OttesenSCG-928-L03]